MLQILESTRGSARLYFVPFCSVLFCSVLYHSVLFVSLSRICQVAKFSRYKFCSLCVSLAQLEAFSPSRVRCDGRKLSIFLEKFMAKRRTSRELPQNAKKKQKNNRKENEELKASLATRFPTFQPQSRVGKQKIILFYCCLAGA